MIIKLGTRKSKLALTQSTLVIEALKKIDPSIEFELHEIITSGDRLYDQNLATSGGKGLFLKEIEDQLLEGKIDIAVHSMKDVPAYLPADLVIDAMLPREDVRDAFISEKYNSITDLPLGATVGTSSPRRKLQLLALRPDLNVINFRGNVETRISKLESQDCHAIILAYAGLKRLRLERVAKQVIDSKIMLPAVGQGAIGIERRCDDEKIASLLAKINHSPTFTAVTCERSFMQKLAGDCTTPLAALATIEGNYIHMKVGYAANNSKVMQFFTGIDTLENCQKLGEDLANKFSQPN
jgi:hydroxymethylbilane synthase